MDPGLREFVRRRGEDACEYCRIPQRATPLLLFHLEHVVPRQHGGSDDPDGLALACDRRNAYKGPNLAGFVWDDRFARRGGHVAGLTPIGRATVRLLNMNGHSPR
jgi:HNH endonuclease